MSPNKGFKAKNAKGGVTFVTFHNFWPIIVSKCIVYVSFEF